MTQIIINFSCLTTNQKKRKEKKRVYGDLRTYPQNDVLKLSYLWHIHQKVVGNFNYRFLENKVRVFNEAINNLRKKYFQLKGNSIII